MSPEPYSAPAIITEVYPPIRNSRPDATVAGSQRLDEAGNPIGPRYKGLPGEFIEVHPELVWMIEADRPELRGSDPRRASSFGY